MITVSKRNSRRSNKSKHSEAWRALLDKHKRAGGMKLLPIPSPTGKVGRPRKPDLFGAL